MTDENDHELVPADEELIMPIMEVWVTDNGRRYRVYRGRNAEHAGWKMQHHAGREPELVVIDD